MEWNQIQVQWRDFAGSARAHWIKLTEDDWEAITGTKGHLVGRVQKRYGITWKEAETQVDDWSGGLLNIVAPLEGASAPDA